MVRVALEGRNLPQNPEVGLQGGGIEAANSRSAGEPDLGILHSELEAFLDDHAEPFGFSNACRPREASRTGHLLPSLSALLTFIFWKLFQ